MRLKKRLKALEKQIADLGKKLENYTYKSQLDINKKLNSDILTRCEECNMPIFSAQAKEGKPKILEKESEAPQFNKGGVNYYTLTKDGGYAVHVPQYCEKCFKEIERGNLKPKRPKSE